MTFISASATIRRRAKPVLSADNALPERHILVDLLRKAAPRIGLTPPVVATLDALLSCLPPQRTHHTVFASNATLTLRRNGISDRTIRRHVAILAEAGLLARHDSPNGKRYTRHNATEGKILRFGFDLTPLFERATELAALAAETMREAELIAYHRVKIRSAVQTRLEDDPEDAISLHVLRVLRRKLSLEDCETLLADLCKTPLAAEQDAVETTCMSASDGQNVRHHHKSTKEHIDTETQDQPEAATMTVSELIAACPEAVVFALRKIHTIADVIDHARSLAPMMGIDAQSYERAQHKIGPFRTATTIWAMMQFHHRIKAAGAYFRAITYGTKSQGFDPVRLIRQLAKAQDGGFGNCPRTT